MVARPGEPLNPPGDDARPRQAAEGDAAPGSDTIVARASAAGQGERAIVRLSGPRAHAVVAELLDGAPPPQPGTRGEGRLLLAEGAPVPVGVLSWRGPRSFTGEDVVELHLPGWPVLVTEVLRRCARAGCRPARRGEFTRRAVVHGRLDLAQAEAVRRLCESADEDEAAAAARALGGTLDALHEGLRERLLDTLALLEAHVDFEEEDTESIRADELLAGLGQARELARSVAATASVRAPRDGETDVVLLGPPNAGKSTLMAALAPGCEPLVAPWPGTTRDALEARVRRGGRAWRVLDGPGVLPDGGAAPLDDLDMRAMAAWIAGLPVDAVVLAAVGADEPAPAAAWAHVRALAGDRPLVPVLTKSDLPGPADGFAGVRVCAPRGEGLEALWDALHAAAPDPGEGGDPWVAAEAEAVAELTPALDELLDGPGGLPADLAGLSVLLRDVLERLDAERDRRLDPDTDLLDRIFGRFCVGK